MPIICANWFAWLNFLYHQLSSPASKNTLNDVFKCHDFSSSYCLNSILFLAGGASITAISAGLKTAS